MSKVSSVEIDQALDNFSGIWNQFKEEINQKLGWAEEQEGKHKTELAEKDEEISYLEESQTDSELEFEKLDVMNYKLKEGNLWVQQILENLNIIVQKKGTKYLLDRLEITVKAINV